MKIWFAATVLFVHVTSAAAASSELSADGWASLLHTHAGKPALIHFWGITCGPCLAELPEWGKWLRQRPDLPLVMIEADPVLVTAAQADGVLLKAGLGTAEQWRLDISDDRLRHRINSDWAGELPMTLLVARDGKITTMTGSADFRAARGWLDRETAP